MSLEGPCSALATVGIGLSDHHLKEEQSEVQKRPFVPFSRDQFNQRNRKKVHLVKR